MADQSAEGALGRVQLVLAPSELIFNMVTYKRFCSVQVSLQRSN